MRSKLLILVAILVSFCLPQAHGAAIENLASKAEVVASSRYSRDYFAQYAVDGCVPQLECKDDKRQGADARIMTSTA